MADALSVGGDLEFWGEYRVKVVCVGVKDEAPTWEPVSVNYHDAPLLGAQNKAHTPQPHD